MPRPLISVVIPAYNVSAFVDTCLGSLLAQTLGFDRIEVVAVDDGSTDDTGSRLDAFAAGRSNVHVLHQPNSGGPGAPRNRGVERATGEYLFFLDPDDYLGVEALERMAAAAQRNDADVVLGRIIGVGRSAPRRPFFADVERGDLWSTGAIWSLSSQKLFRRSLVVEHGLRFLEGSPLGEDQEFVVGAYLAARTFSVVASTPCYYLVLRPQGGNATRAVPDPGALFDIVGRVLELVVDRVPRGRLRDELLARFYEVEVSGKVRGHRLLAMREQVRADCVARLQPLTAHYFGEDVLAGARARERLRAHLLRHGRQAELVELARFDTAGQVAEPLAEDGRLYARLPFFRQGVAPDSVYEITDELALEHCREQARWDGGRLHLHWSPRTPVLAGPDVRWSCELRAEHGALDRHVPLTRTGTAQEAVLDVAGGPGVEALADGVWYPYGIVRQQDRLDGKFVGALGTLAPVEEPASRLLDDRLARLTVDGHGRVRLELGSTSSRLPVALQELVADGGRLVRLRGTIGVLPATEPSRWTATLVLRRRGTDEQAAVQVQLDGTAPGGWQFCAHVDADLLRAGVWDPVLRLTSATGVLEGRLRAAPDLPTPAAQVQAGRVLVPYTTVRGNVSLDLRASTVRLDLVASVVGVGWAPAGAVLELGLRSGLRTPVHQPVRRSVVLEQAGQEVAVPLDAPPGPDGVVDVHLDLAGLVAAGLGPGRWALLLRAEVEGLVRTTRLGTAAGAVVPELPVHRWRQAGLSWLSAGLVADGGRDGGTLLEVRQTGPHHRASTAVRALRRRAVLPSGSPPGRS